MYVLQEAVTLPIPTQIMLVLFPSTLICIFLLLTHIRSAPGHPIGWAFFRTIKKTEIDHDNFERY